MNQHITVFNKFHQSRFVKILCQIIAFFTLYWSVEPALAALQREEGSYNLVERLQPIRAEVDAEYERNQHNESFRDLLQNLRNKGRNGMPTSQRNPFGQLRRGQRPDPYFGRSAPIRSSSCRRLSEEISPLRVRSQ